MDCALPSGYRPKGKWLQAIHDLWGNLWVPKMDFGLQARLEKEARIRLDTEQFEMLQGAMENDSVLVTGAAGTGKTVVALALARNRRDRQASARALLHGTARAGWTSRSVHRIRQSGLSSAMP